MNDFLAAPDRYLMDDFKAFTVLLIEFTVTVGTTGGGIYIALQPVTSFWIAYWLDM